jgi:succinyl-diaminopimelate desuccinylase
MNTLELTKALIAIPSITPDGSKALDYIESVLVPLGFVAKRKTFSAEGTASVDNLFIRYGTAAPHFMFAGHVDVVPVGDESKWTSPPFEPTIRNGKLYGRGAEDMKGAIACFIAAAVDFINSGKCKGSISLLLTSDEEGVAINGSRKCVPWLKEIGEVPDVAVVGEPTNPTYIGEMVKIGRRGSLYFALEVTGKQGHVAYPHLADNPITMLANILTEIKAKPLDNGNDFFLPTGLEITSIESSPAAQNVIPEWARAKLSVRFNTEQTAEGIEAKLANICDAHAKGKYTLTPRLSGEPFLTQKGALSDLMVKSIQKVTGHTPDLSTTGGTSDARFIKDICPVVEFGTTGFTPHMVNECVGVDDLELLTKCYRQILENYFS